VNIEIWSDVACPWCYLGKRRFEEALAGFEHRDAVDVRWRSFELDPGAPSERPVDVATHVAQKLGIAREEVVASQRRLADLGAAEGIEYRFDLVRGGNTFDAHRLLALAAEEGLQGELKERLLRAHHSEGEPLGDPATLARLGVEAGLDPAQVADVLAGERYAEQVRDDERTAASLGIGGVPFFVVDRAIAVSGAQGTDVFAEFLQRGWESRAGVAGG